MDNESYMKIRKAIEKSLKGIGSVLNWFEPVDINSISEPGKTRVTFELKDAKEPKPPTPDNVRYFQLIDSTNDRYSVIVIYESDVLDGDNIVFGGCDIIEFDCMLDPDNDLSDHLAICNKGLWRVCMVEEHFSPFLDGEFYCHEMQPLDYNNGTDIPKNFIYKFKKVERKEQVESTPPTPPSKKYYHKYFDVYADEYIEEELVFENDNDALKGFKFIIENNTDKARWNPMALYHRSRLTLYSCDKHKPDYQKIDEINAKLRNMK